MSRILMGESASWGGQLGHQVEPDGAGLIGVGAFEVLGDAIGLLPVVPRCDF
jgi:hypothetical protein